MGLFCLFYICSTKRVGNLFISLLVISYMAIGVTFIIIAVVIVGIWILIEAKRMKHKIFAVFLILLILFTYISFAAVMRNNDIDLKSPSGLATAGKLYLSWLGGIFHNMKTITAYAFKQDWKVLNETDISKEKEEKRETIWDRFKS